MILNSQIIRNAAGQVQSAASRMENDVQLSSRTNNHFSGQLEGRFAEALEEELRDFTRDVQTLQGGLVTIQATLVKFAEKIEAIDRLAQQIIRSK